MTADAPPRVDLSDVEELTRARFDRMKPLDADQLPVIPNEALPAGPGWPILVQSAALMRFRHTFVPWLHKRFGDTFTVRVMPHNRPIVLFSRPEDIKEIFAGDPEVFYAGRANSILGPVMGEHSLLLQDSSAHKRARKLLMPAFNGQALRSYSDLVRAVAIAEVDRWNNGGEFSALDRMNAVTLEVILKVVFGVSDEARLAQMRPLVNRTVDVPPYVFLGWGHPKLNTVGPWKAAVETSYALDRLIYAEIRERRLAADLAERTDVLSRLILAGEGDDRLSDTELRDQLVTLLLAGHETTATALSWTLYELGRHPELLARSREAARTGDDDWLEAIQKESMRLHPVVAMVVRTLLKPATIAGRELPEGATVGASILLSHSRSEAHPDPEQFRPERFVGQNPPPNTWIPFGGGVRRCIGAGFSMMEAVTVLREILLRFDVESLGEERPKVRNVTSVPHDRARIRVTR